MIPSVHKPYEHVGRVLRMINKRKQQWDFQETDIRRGKIPETSAFYYVLFLDNHLVGNQACHGCQPIRDYSCYGKQRKNEEDQVYS